MFDSIRCDFRLPNSAHNLVDNWQTKSLTNTLSIYIITDEGRLLLESPVYEEVSREDHDDFLGPMRVKELRIFDTHYHGVVRFYTLYPENHDWSSTFVEDMEQEWVEYEAKFTDGQLVQIGRVLGPNWGKIQKAIDDTFWE
jgi:hypothetical protein